MGKVMRSDVLWRAWVVVRRNNGAPGIDKITLAQVEGYGVARLLGELAGELRERGYRRWPPGGFCCRSCRHTGLGATAQSTDSAQRLRPGRGRRLPTGDRRRTP